MSRRSTTHDVLLLAAVVMLTAAPARAQEKSPGQASTSTAPPAGSSASAADAAKALANPNSDLASLKFQNQFFGYTGDLPGADDQNSYQLLFQPIFPFGIGNTSSGAKKTFYVRPAIPLAVDQPRFSARNNDFSGVSGLGDIGFDVAIGFTEKSGVLWALGMDGTLPTASDSDLGGGQLRLGPEALIAKDIKLARGSAFIGFFPSHQWDVAGWKDGQFSTTKVEPFITYLPGGGWSIGSDPKMTYDWVDNEWTIPLNLQVGKIVKFGKTPVKIELEGSYYVEQPDRFGPDWMIGVNFTPVVPNFIENWFKGR